MARNFRGKKIDFLSWGGTTATFAALSAGSTAIKLLSSSLTPYTLMRLRGNLLAYLDGFQAPGGGIVITMGIHLVPDGTDTTVLVEPFNDSATKWLWYSEFALAYEEAVTDVIDMPGASSYRLVIDNKAMRKVAPEQEVQLVMTNTSVLTARNCNVIFTGRFLFGR